MFTGLHTRKLGIRALLKVLAVPYAQQPAVIQDVWAHIVPIFLALFSKLAEAYERASMLLPDRVTVGALLFLFF